MIRSGGRRCLADATCFIPDLKDINELNQLLEQEEFDDITKKTIKCFKNNIVNLVDNFEEATEYFKVSYSKVVSCILMRFNLALG